jgi:hypothetical protein
MPRPRHRKMESSECTKTLPTLDAELDDEFAFLLDLNVETVVHMLSLEVWHVEDVELRESLRVFVSHRRRGGQAAAALGAACGRGRLVAEPIGSTELTVLPRSFKRCLSPLRLGRGSLTAARGSTHRGEGSSLGSPLPPVVPASLKLTLSNSNGPNAHRRRSGPIPSEPFRRATRNHGRGSRRLPVVAVLEGCGPAGSPRIGAVGA